MKNVKHLFLLVLCSLLLIPVAASSGNILTLEPFSIKGGETKDLVIDLENDMEITLVQFDLKLPEGLSVEDKGTATKPKYQIKLYDDTRTTLEDHQVSSNYVVDSENGNYYKVILSSSDNTEITGNSGALLKISLCAASTFKTGTITLKNILLVAPDETPVHPDPVSLDITLPKVTVTINNAERKYGENNPQFTYTASTNDDLTGLVTLNCEATKTSNIGEYAITGTSTATDLEVTFVNGKLTVNPAALTVTADAKTKTFGAADPELTYVATGLVNGDQLTGALTRAEGQAVGTYAIEQGTLAASSNYTLTFNGANLTITAKSVTSPTIELATTTFGYDGTAKEPAVTVKDGQTVISASEYTVSYSNNTNAGTATVTITDKAGGTYTVNGSTTFTIAKAALTVKAKDASRYAGEENPTFEFEYTGFKNNETESVLTTKPTATTTADANSAAGQYDIVVSGGEAQNYEIARVNGKLTVNAKLQITITAKNASRTYGSQNPTFEYTVTGGQITGTPELTCVAVPGSPVGEYAIVVSKGTVSAAPRYDFTFVNGKLTVTKAMLTATAENKERVYGAANPALTISYSGFAAGDDASKLATQPVASTTAIETSKAGTYDITVAGGADTNYDFTYSKGTLTITKAQLTAKADNASRTYGAANPAFTVSYEGFLNNDNETVLTTKPTATTTASIASGVGTYDITVSGGSSDNYDFNYSTGTLTITKAQLTAKAANASRAYGAANPTFTVSYTGFLNNDNAETAISSAPLATTTANATSGVGTYDITVAGGAAANYDITDYQSGTLTITPAALTVKAKDAQRYVGDENPAFELEYIGFLNNETPAVLTTMPTVMTTATAESPVGVYDITVSGGQAQNYTLSYVNGKLTVADKSSITITATNVSMTYGDAVPQFEYTVIGGELEGTPEFTCQATSGSPVGTYTIVVAKGSITTDANFTFHNGTLIINKAPLTVKAKDATRKVGEENPAFELEYIGFKNNETADVLTTKPTAMTTATAASPAGEYAVTVSGGEAQNYSFTYVNGKLTVAEKPVIVITAKSVSRAYGDANPQFECIVDGESLQGTPELTCEAVATSPVGTYIIKVAQGTVTNDANFTFVDGTLTVTAAKLTVTALDATRVEGEENPTFELEYSGFKNNETVEVLTTKPTATTTATVDNPAGEYAIAVSGGVAQNYSFEYVSGKLTVTEKPVEHFEERGEIFNVEDDGVASFAGISEMVSTAKACEIPASVTYAGNTYVINAIAAEAFKNNNIIEEIAIPASIEHIGPSAFAGCTNLQRLIVNIVTPLVFSAAESRALVVGAVGTIFEGVDMESCVLYVPEGSVNLYKSAEVWKEFKTILPISAVGIQSLSADVLPADVYDLRGRKVANAGTSWQHLPKGVYVIGGRKVTR